MPIARCKGNAELLWLATGGRQLEAGSLFVAERLDGVQPRGFEGRKQSEEDPNAGGEADPQRERPPGQRDREVGEPVDEEADGAAEDDADDAAGGRQEDRLDEELPQDLAAARPERLADPDLARALGDR